MHRRSTLLLSLIIGLLLVNTSLYAQSPVDHLKVIIGTQLGTTNIRVADAEGDFAAQNIEIEYVSISNANDASGLVELLQSQVDVFQAGWTAGLFNARGQGEQFRAVAVSSYNDPATCAYHDFVVGAGKAANFDPESLRGAHVAVPSDSSQYYLDLYLAAHGMSLSDVIIDNIPSAARIDALVNGTIVLASLNEPYLSQAENKYGLEPLIGAKDVAPFSSQGVLLFGPSLLNRKDDLPVRFLTAYLEGSHRFNQGPTDRNVEIVSQALKLEPDTLKKGCWIKLSENGEVRPDPVLTYEQWLDKQGLLDAIVPIENFYNPTYVREAYTRATALEAAEGIETPEAEMTQTPEVEATQTPGS